MVSLRDEGVCTGFPLLCQEQLTLGPAPQACWQANCFHVVLNTLKRQRLFPRLWVWDLLSALFRSWITLKSVSFHFQQELSVLFWKI